MIYHYDHESQYLTPIFYYGRRGGRVSAASALGLGWPEQYIYYIPTHDEWWGEETAEGAQSVLTIHHLRGRRRRLHTTILYLPLKLVVTTNCNNYQLYHIYIYIYDNNYTAIILHHRDTHRTILYEVGGNGDDDGAMLFYLLLYYYADDG